MNGLIVSYIFVSYNGISYKDLDIIFGVDILSDEEFYVVKDVVLSCLFDFLLKGVKKEKIILKIMKEVYV